MRRAVELLEGEAATPAAVAGALAAMTLAIGRRVIIVEGVERWREADVAEHLAPAMAQMPPDTTLALFAREEGRAKAPAALHEAVRRAGGQVVAQMTVKPWELAGWVREQARAPGPLARRAAAKALVAQVGERQQRLLRELEKLALEGEALAGGRALGGRRTPAWWRHRRRTSSARGPLGRVARLRARRRARGRDAPRGRSRPTCACASRASGSRGSST